MDIGGVCFCLEERCFKFNYQVLAFDCEFFDELCGLVSPRNEVVWFGANFEFRQMQFEFNRLWFDTSFTVLRY